MFQSKAKPSACAAVCNGGNVMSTCRSCGRTGLFVFVDSDGLCSNCRKGYQKALKQSQRLQSELETVQKADALTPDVYGGHERSYLYKDVSAWVVWQFGGSYGKDCKGAGIRRGDKIDLIPRRRKDEPKEISLCWRGTEVAHMRSGRMRDMVHRWRKSHLPVLCMVSHVGGESNLLLEFAFYGSPPSNYSRKKSSSKK